MEGGGNNGRTVPKGISRNSGGGGMRFCPAFDGVQSVENQLFCFPCQKDGRSPSQQRRTGRTLCRILCHLPQTVDRFFLQHRQGTPSHGSSGQQHGGTNQLLPRIEVSGNVRNNGTFLHLHRIQPGAFRRFCKKYQTTSAATRFCVLRRKGVGSSDYRQAYAQKFPFAVQHAVQKENPQ